MPLRRGGIFTGRGAGIVSGPVGADSEAILATKKTEARRRGWSCQGLGEKDQVQGRDLPQRRAGGGLV